MQIIVTQTWRLMWSYKIIAGLLKYNKLTQELTFGLWRHSELLAREIITSNSGFNSVKFTRRGTYVWRITKSGKFFSIKTVWCSRNSLVLSQYYVEPRISLKRKIWRVRNKLVTSKSRRIVVVNIACQLSQPPLYCHMFMAQMHTSISKVSWSWK